MGIAPAKGAPVVFSVILLLLAVPLVAGGIELAFLGGSLYYVITGVVLVASAVLLWRARKLGMWIYLFVLAYTLLWSFWEIGLDGWALASRMGLLIVLAIYFVFPGVRRRLS